MVSCPTGGRASPSSPACAATVAVVEPAPGGAIRDLSARGGHRAVLADLGYLCKRGISAACSQGSARTVDDHWTGRRRGGRSDCSRWDSMYPAQWRGIQAADRYNGVLGRVLGASSRRSQYALARVPRDFDGGEFITSGAKSRAAAFA